LISLSFFDQSGHIDAFRSIVGEAWGGQNLLVRAVDFAESSRETAAGSRIGHVRVAAMLRARYARRDAAGFGI
jgi:hypothetical protein